MRSEYQLYNRIGEPNTDVVQVLITGDFCPINRVSVQSKNEEFNTIFGELKPFLQKNDFSITNLECPLTESTNKIKKSGPHLKASPHTINILNYVGVNAVTLANNHCLDFDEVGLADTIRTCNEAGISTVGAGENIIQAGKPLYIKRKGITIGVVNICEEEFSIANANHSGANPLDYPLNFSQITEAKQNSDSVLIIFHGGNEGYTLPRPKLKSTFRYFIDLGASAVVCHHSHTYSGFEIYKEAPIFYGLGNFIFDSEKEIDKNWFTGYMVKLGIGINKIVEYSIIPYKQYNEISSLQKLTVDEFNHFKQELDSRSSYINNPDKLDQEWRSFVDLQSTEYLSRLFALNRWQKALVKRGIMRNAFLKRNKIPMIQNLLQCDSHREAILRILKSY